MKTELTSTAHNEYRVFRKGKLIKGETRKNRNAAKRDRRARRG